MSFIFLSVFYTCNFVVSNSVVSAPGLSVTNDVLIGYAETTNATGNNRLG